MSKYKVLIFDADGTLFDFEKSEMIALQKSFENLNLIFDKSIHLSIYKNINAEIWAEFEEGKISSTNLKQERFKRYINHFKFKVAPLLFSEIYLKYLSEAAFLLNGAEELLLKLRFGMFKMVLLTNGLTNVQENRFKISNMKKYFIEIIISENVGLKKPQKEIFELAMERIQHNTKNDVLMIGDNLSSDILGGINFGIDTCWYNPLNQKSKDGIIPTYQVSTFEEIQKIV